MSSQGPIGRRDGEAVRLESGQESCRCSPGDWEGVSQKYGEFSKLERAKKHPGFSPSIKHTFNLHNCNAFG